MYNRIIPLLFIFGIFQSDILFTQEKQDKDATLSIIGTIRSSMTQNQIPGVTITVMDTKTGAISKTDGTYAVKGLQKGIYSVRFSAIGFQTYIQSNIMVTNVNPVQLDIELIDKVIELKGVEVRSSYFTKNIETVTSTQTLNSEDVKRAPGVQEMS